jgi:drug/metabolite transporter superfamily protein YnfA
LSLPIAVADLMILNIGVAWAWLRRTRTHRPLLYAAIALFVCGTLSSGEFSAAIALALCAVVIVVLAKNARPLATSLPVVVAAALFLRPVIERRLSGFASPNGLPISWVGRLQHLRT